ncbi:MAG: EamA family transporter [Actinomycetota bacterium]|nr:EamA family transporter [Actinomycetota bacterium]
MSGRGWLLFAAMCVIWGIPYLLIKVAVSELSPAMLVLARTGIAAALLLPIAALRSELRPLLAYWRPLLVFAAIEIAIPWMLLGVAEQRISSSLTGLLIAAVPLFTALIVRTTGARERLGTQSVIGLVLGFVGVAAIVGVNAESAGVGPIAAMAVVALCYAIGPVILQRYLAGVPALGVIAASLGLTALVYIPIAAFSAPDQMPRATVVASVIGLAVVCTAIAFLVFFALIAEVGPARATAFIYVNPAVAALLGMAILDERLTVGMGVGFVLILAGSVLVARRPKRATQVGVPALASARDSA